MNEIEHILSVKKFVEQWTGCGYGKGETHAFWLSLLRDVLGISEPEKLISFEVPVKLKHTSFIIEQEVIDGKFVAGKIPVRRLYTNAIRTGATLREQCALLHAPTLDHRLQLRPILCV